MIIYIHGFGGSGYGSKAKEVKDFFSCAIAPSLSYNPFLAIETLKEIIESLQKHEEISLIGSSLGGYYSMYLGERYDLKTVLLNPSIFPYHTLANSLGEAKNFYDNTNFSWNKEHIQQLKKYEVPKITKKENFLLLAQKGDELLDYKEAQEKLFNCEMILDEGGSHGYENFFKKLPVIERFLSPY